MNKQQKEDHIDSALLTLQREYARLELLRDVHSSDTMKRAIADAYSSCIEFAEEVTLYYSRPTYLRVLEAFTKPPRLGIDKKIAAITEAMTEVRTERATLDSKRLHQVQQSMGEVQRNVNEINGAVEGRTTYLKPALTIVLIEPSSASTKRETITRTFEEIIAARRLQS